MRRVVITGLGALTPLGNTVEAFKEGLFEVQDASSQKVAELRGNPEAG